MELEAVRKVLAERIANGCEDHRFTLSGPRFVSNNSVIYQGECEALPSPFAVKCIRHAKFMGQFEALSTVESGLEALDEFAVPHPILMLEDEQIIVMEWIDGENLSEALTRFGLSYGDAESRVIRAARWLHHFHKIKPFPPAPLPVQGRMDHLRDEAAQVPSQRHGPVQEAFRLLEETIEPATDPLIAQGMVHGDFKPENVIFTDRKTVGIDFAFRFENVVVFDVANFITHLVLLAWKPRGIASGLHRHRYRLAEAFVSGYTSEGASLPAAPLAWMRLYHLVRIQLRQLRAPWSRPSIWYLKHAVGREIAQGMQALRQAREAPVTSSGPPP